MEIGGDGRIAIVNSINPFRLEGQKTAAFEIIEELGNAPDLHILPVGNAGNISAYWMGYREFHRLGRAAALPRMIGFQAAGSAPIYLGHPVDHPETVATAIRIGNPASWTQASAALTESNGTIDIVTDDEILAAQKWLSSNEGIFVEPASAASVAGLMKCTGPDRCPSCPFQKIAEGRQIVLTVTGHGLKDPDVARSQCTGLHTVPADRAAILGAIGL